MDLGGPALTLQGAFLHNLQKVDLHVPLGHLVVVTGVSGSGKSTLARDVLLANLQFINTRGGKPNWSGCEKIDGWGFIDRVLEVDQTPIGKTPRSCPATYIGFWDTITSCLPTRWRPRRAVIWPAASASTPAKGAARPAKAPACVPSV